MPLSRPRRRTKWESSKARKARKAREQETTSDIHEVEQILSDRVTRELCMHKKSDDSVVIGLEKKHEYLIRWRGFRAACDTWEPESHLDCPEKLYEYERMLENYDQYGEEFSEFKKRQVASLL